MRQLVIVVSFLVLAPIVTHAQTANCKQRECIGKAPNEYDHGDYHYLTTSRVYKDGNDHFYETCVQNLGSNDLEVNWIIPGPDTVVPKGCAVTAPRPFAKRDTIDTHRGCLRYGAKWEWDRSPFFPHANDQEQISNEAKTKCKDVKISEAQQIQLPVRDIAVAMERFGPSLHEDFKRTLSRIEFNVGIDANFDERIFVTKISAKFSAAYENQSEFYSKGFTIRPTDYFIDNDFFAEATGKPLGGFFVRSALIEYTLPIPKNPVQSFVRYAVFSVDEKPVASIDVPVWVESQ